MGVIKHTIFKPKKLMHTYVDAIRVPGSGFAGCSYGAGNIFDTNSYTR